MDNFTFKTSFARDGVLMLTCSKCKEQKAHTEFTKTGIKTIKPTARRAWQAYCKDCLRAYGREHRRANLEHYKQRNNKYGKNAKSKLKQLLRITSTVDRSRLDFDVLYKNLEENNFCCAITGVPFVYEPRHPKALSIDKIDPSKPYTMDNVRLICLWVNVAMSNWGLETLKELITEWQIKE